ncbi:recombinase family protein [Nocardia rhizosphaerihabitans]|uniref:recombinase family protein n=1 Tax=Nocardia rhizosphaerihabitans TaxID=1691570 RepID=UPI003672B6F4
MPLNPKDFPDLAPWIYGRNSEDKAKHMSVPAQVKWGRAQADLHGWLDPRVTIDEDISATRWAPKERPGYKELVAGLSQPAPDGKRWVLLVRSSSRANRQLGEFAELRDQCGSLGVLWYTNGSLFDLDNPHDRRFLSHEAVDNEFAPEQNRLDSMAQLNQNFLDGRPHSREAYGYRIVYVRGKAVDRLPDETTAPIVQEMVDRLLTGESAASVARWLRDAAIATPAAELRLPCRRCSETVGRRVLKAVDRRSCPCPQTWRTDWDHTTVRKVVCNPTIAGLRAHTDRRTGVTATTPATWERLITDEQHEQITAKFADPRRRENHRGVEPRWLLSGIPRCGKCEYGRIINKLGRPNRKRRYDCERFCVSRDADLVDDLVEEAVLQWLEDPSLLAALARTDEEAEAASEQAKVLRAKFDQWINDAISEGLSPSEIRQYKQSHEPAVKAAEVRANASLPMPHVVKAAGPDARTKWRDPVVTPLKAKRAIIRSLLEITIHPAGRRAGFGVGASVETIEIQRLVA